MAGLGTLGLGEIGRARAAALASARAAGQDTSLLLIWLDGGPSRMDTCDLKPEAPTDFRGIWNPIKSNVPGVDPRMTFHSHAGRPTPAIDRGHVISELFQGAAAARPKRSVLRSFFLTVR